MGILTKIFKKKSNIVSLILDENGKNFMGGNPPPDITIPELETSPMVYIGFISKDESHLPSIDFDLHLICPIFIDLQSAVFFDYSDPKNPKLIRENVPSNFAQLFDAIPNTAQIEYKKLNFVFDKVTPTKTNIGVNNLEVIPREIGKAGTPNWMHDEDWPHCPITGNKMEFLFQLGDIDDCNTVKGQDILNKEYMDPYLNFGHGYLYIFYEPETKVIGYLNQL